MNKATSQDILFTLCIDYLQRMREDLRQRSGFSSEEIAARLKLMERVYEAAAGVALQREIKKESLELLKNLVEDIEDTLQWNRK